MNAFEEQLLSLVTLDFERIETIKSELAEAIGFVPSQNEIHDALLMLENEKYIKAYMFESDKNQYAEVDLNHNDFNEIWFMATNKGKASNAE